MPSGSIPRLRVGPLCQDRRSLSHWPVVWLTLWLAAAALAPAWAGVAQLTASGQSGQYPQINNRGQVAWAGYDGAHYSIVFWDGATARTLMQLQTQFPYVQLSDAGQAVWADSTGVFLWDGRAVLQIRSTSIGADPQAAVVNNAGQVAWVEAGQVYLWNGFSTQALGASGGMARLNNQGQVMWPARDSLNQQIFLWNGVSLRKLTSTASTNDYPQLNDAGQVVWWNPLGSQSHIFLWNGASAQELPGPPGSRPQINRSGQVVWVGDDPTTLQIYRWDGATTQPLTQYAPDRSVAFGESWSFPQINDVGQVVWQRFDETDQNRQIYRWSSGTIQQLSDDSRDNFNPYINNAGQVVWESKAAYQPPGANTPPSIPSTVFLYTPSKADSLDLSPTPVVGGHSATGTITLGAAAPTGTVVTLSSANPAVASVPASVTVAAGQASASFPVTTTAVAAATSVVLSASSNGATYTATLQVLPPALTGESVDLISAVGGIPATGTVTLSDPAPAGGLTVVLSSSSPAATVPAGVTVPGGSRTATFPIQTHPVAAQTAVTFTAAFNGVTQTAGLQVLPPVLASVLFSTSTVTAGDDAAVTVTLTGPAPAGGLVVTLSSPDAALPLPAGVTVPAGSTSRYLEIQTRPVASSDSVTIAAVAGGVTRTAMLTLLPISVTDMTLSPSPVLRGHRAQGTIRLSSPAPPGGGVVVTLSSANPAVARLAAQVTVPAGQSAATFPVATARVRTVTDVILTAAAGGTTQTATLTVMPAGITRLSLRSARLRGGASMTGTLTLYGPAPAGGAVVTLSSSQPDVVHVPAMVTIPAGARSVTFPVTTTRSPAATVVSIGAAYAGVTLTADLEVARR